MVHDDHLSIVFLHSFPSDSFLFDWDWNKNFDNEKTEKQETR